MRLLLTICLGFAALLSAGQDDSGKIYYDQARPLTWDDFTQRVRVPLPGYKAYTWSGIGIELTSDSEGIHITVGCYFVKGESWVEKGAESPELLRHEQGHFDLAELHTRRLRAALEPYQNMEVSEFVRRGGQELVQSTYDRIFDEMNQEQERYDKETEHSILRDKQKAWDADIARRLQETQ